VSAASTASGDIDLTLLSYLDCVENSFMNYAKKVPQADFLDSFDYLAFHTPFAGMVKGAHRTMMRKFKKVPPDVINADFDKRVLPSLQYVMDVGNLAGASLYLALCGLIDNAEIDSPKKVGLFSYGSGCASEFYSGTITPQSKIELAKMKIREKLNSRYALNMTEYDQLLDLYAKGIVPQENYSVDVKPFSNIYKQKLEGRDILVYKGLKNYHREYEFLNKKSAAAVGTTQTAQTFRF
jgi:polyketide biosynthesis 3-hydroxy-3-methylglutaryl-CoA synthase-like enzyme PksG